MQTAVHSLIASEMRSFAPSDYLAYLPYPELKFMNSTALQVNFFCVCKVCIVLFCLTIQSFQAEMHRLETAPSSSSEKLNMDRYNGDKPSKSEEKNEQVGCISISVSNRPYCLKLTTQHNHAIFIRFGKVQ